jgi:hypothetical protein
MGNMKNVLKAENILSSLICVEYFIENTQKFYDGGAWCYLYTYSHVLENSFGKIFPCHPLDCLHTASSAIFAIETA